MRAIRDAMGHAFKLQDFKLHDIHVPALGNKRTQHPTRKVQRTPRGYLNLKYLGALAENLNKGRSQRRQGIRIR